MRMDGARSWAWAAHQEPCLGTPSEGSRKSRAGEGGSGAFITLDPVALAAAGLCVTLGDGAAAGAAEVVGAAAGASCAPGAARAPRPTAEVIALIVARGFAAALATAPGSAAAAEPAARSRPASIPAGAAAAAGAGAAALGSSMTPRCTLHSFLVQQALPACSGLNLLTAPRTLVANLGDAADDAVGRSRALARTTELDHTASASRSSRTRAVAAARSERFTGSSRSERRGTPFQHSSELPPPK